ncbi:hypothetical protein [Janthinobacterium agaricidamnosum]|uniref:hypothetical protein n=1 Tax=Janthinobacterium agaricidamnosum TaxID=55508 RepID=UPI000AD38452|nr:hypothetical protein [Janthinobacterium agaricidamnosum]
MKTKLAARKCFRQIDALQKYNNKLGLFGFLPILACTINQAADLDAISVYGSAHPSAE